MLEPGIETGRVSVADVDAMDIKSYNYYNMPSIVS